MKAFQTDVIETEFLPIRQAIYRKRFVLFGWHFLTIYKYKTNYKIGPNYSESWWIYIAENFGFGIQVPWSGHYE